MRSSRRSNVLALIAGIVIGGLSLAPGTAHVSDRVPHLWSEHIRPRVKDEFYTQRESDSRFVKKDSTTRGFFSCPSTAWYPDENDDAYWTSGSKRFSTTSPVSVFYCNATLPHGATVTSVRFSLYDAVSPDFVACSLLRTNLVTHGEIDMAAVATDPPVGDTIQTDKTIAKPTIDNKRFTYAFKCALFGSDASIGFYGASAGYELSAGT